MSVARIRGIDYVYDVHGIAGDLPVLLIHGHPFDRSMWAPQVDALASRYRLIVPDLRGYGETSVPEGTTLLDEVALDLAHLLDTLAEERAVVCGLSMGGQIAMEFARLFPTRVLGLVLCDTDARAETPSSYAARRAMAERLEQDGMRGYVDDQLGRFLHPCTFQERPHVVAHMRRMMLAAPSVGAARLQRGRAERRDHSAALRQLALPTLVVVGDRDDFTPTEVAQHIVAQIPDATLTVVEATGHMPNLEDPPAFNAALVAFLSRVAAARSRTEGGD